MHQLGLMVKNGSQVGNILAQEDIMACAVDNILCAFLTLYKL